MGFLISGPLISGLITRNTMVFKIVVIVCITSGLISFVLFHVQKHMFSNEPVELSEKIRWDLWSVGNETSIRSIERAKTREEKEQTLSRAKKILLTLEDLFWTLLEYADIVRESYVWVMLGHPIWASMNILTMFLPGIEWQSYGQQKLPGKQLLCRIRIQFFEDHIPVLNAFLGKIELCPEKGYRLSWFISSLFFPFYALASRVISHRFMGKYSHFLSTDGCILESNVEP